MAGKKLAVQKMLFLIKKCILQDVLKWKTMTGDFGNYCWIAG